MVYNIMPRQSESFTDKSSISVCYPSTRCRDCKQELFDNVRNGDFGMGDFVYRHFKYTVRYVRHKNDSIIYMLDDAKKTWSGHPKGEVYNIVRMRISSDLKDLYEGLLSVEDPKDMDEDDKRRRLEDIETQKKKILAMHERVQTSEGMTSIMRYAAMKFSADKCIWEIPLYLGC